MRGGASGLVLDDWCVLLSLGVPHLPALETRWHFRDWQLSPGGPAVYGLASPSRVPAPSVAPEHTWRSWEFGSSGRGAGAGLSFHFHTPEISLFSPSAS